ncbi:sulfatase [candidate division KSB1 bacterium]|nr:sulfatase [candidate division KSB1 bacterium]
MEKYSSTRRRFLKTAAAALAGTGSMFYISRCGPQKPLNILWLISEDTSPDIGCYGNPLVKTPNLDRLAAEGIRYTNVYATCPVCSPSRSAFMTGMYQTFTGAHQHRTRDKQPLPDPVKVITHYFRRAGYFTANVTEPAEGISGTGKTDWNFIPGEEPFDGTDWNQRTEGQPFFAQVNFQLTHREFQRDPENPIDPAGVELPPYYPDHPITRRDWANYLESLQVLDRQIGAVLKRLEDEGLLDNTAVFYFGDHGRCMVRGKQWLYDGGIRIPLFIRLPKKNRAGRVDDNMISMIDLGPTAMRLAGITPPEHLQGRPFLGGRIKSRKYIISARDRCDETDDRIRCVRTKQYKYIRNFFPERPYTQFNAYKTNQYPLISLLPVLHKQGKLTPVQERWLAPQRPGEELYDVSADPHEIDNLAEKPEHAKVLNKMRSILDDWIEKTGDMGEKEEPDDVKKYWDDFMAARYKDWMEAKGLTVNSTPEQHVKYWQKKLFKGE